MWATGPGALRNGRLDCRSGYRSGGEADGPPRRLRRLGRSKRARGFQRPTPYSDGCEIPRRKNLVRAPRWCQRVDPRHLPFNKIPPPVRIERITANGKTYDASNGLRLPSRIHDLKIDYNALSFVVPEKVQFRYRLEGQDRKWREVVNDREVQYSNLPPETRNLARNGSAACLPIELVRHRDAYTASAKDPARESLQFCVDSERFGCVKISRAPAVDRGKAQRR
jgi:hypothetical protein